MSAYHTQSTCFEDEECLLKSLGEHGYERHMIEVHNEPQTLIDYCGKPRPQKAHIIIRRKFVGGAANDVGFIRGANGKFEAIISSYDSSKHNAKWMTGLTKTYAEHALIKQAPRLGLRFIGKQINAKTGKPEIRFRASR